MADEKLARTHVLLRNGTTVAKDDYDEKVHGKEQIETDDQYRMRVTGRPSGQPIPSSFPRTTIPGLQTVEPEDAAPKTPAVQAPAPVAAASLGKPVATAEPAKQNVPPPAK